MATINALLAINAVFNDEKGVLKSVYCTVQDESGNRWQRSLRVDARNLHTLPADIIAGMQPGAAFIAEIPSTDSGAVVAIKSASSAIVLGAPLSNAHDFRGFAELTEVIPETVPPNVNLPSDI